MLENELLKILRKVQSGELSVPEGAERLETLDGEIEVLPPPAPVEEDFAADLGWWKDAWLIPLGIGTALFVSSAFFTSWTYTNQHFFWFYCSWLPLLLGLLVLLLGLWSIQARWVHVRVQPAEGKRVNISLPLPLALPGWLLRTFAHRVPGWEEKHIRDLPPILDALRQTKEPIIVEVNEKDGERVRVYIL
jgi:hypothetical protein